METKICFFKFIISCIKYVKAEHYFLHTVFTNQVKMFYSMLSSNMQVAVFIGLYFVEHWTCIIYDIIDKL